MANASGRYGSLRNRKERLRAFFKENKRILLLCGALAVLLVCVGLIARCGGRGNMIALLTPTPEAPSATPAVSDSPSPAATPAPTQTPTPTITATPAPAATPVPTLPLYGEVSVHLNEADAWETTRQATSTPRYSMNVRGGPGGDYASIDVFGAGRRVTVFGKQGEWYYIWYGGKFGWVHEDLLRLDEEQPTVQTAISGRQSLGAEYPVLTALPADASLVRLVFSPGCMAIDAAGVCRAQVRVEQYVTFAARELAALAVGSRLNVATLSVEVESLMWERSADGWPVCLLVNDTFRIAYDEQIRFYCLVTNVDGTLTKQRVAFTDLLYTIEFAADALVETPDSLLWGGDAPAATAEPLPDGTSMLPTLEMPVAEFCERLAACPETHFPPQDVRLTMEDGLVQHMFWSFWA